jgi:hypothetical protein
MFLKRLIQKFTKHEKKVLGRWNIEECDIKMNKKIDLSNEDHCGPCGQYILDLKNIDKNETKNETKNATKNASKDIKK